MSHTFKVYHFGGQCPWLWWTLEQVQQAALQLHGSVEVFDVGDKPELASKYRLFFPFMIIIDDRIRWPSPISAESLISLIQNTDTPAVMPAAPVPPPATASQIVAITADNIDAACAFCMPAAEDRLKLAKQEWGKQYGEAILGYLAYEAEVLVGGIEYLRASRVPFPLPDRRSTTALITCLYSTEDARDYRAQILAYALSRLPDQGYQAVQVIAGQREAYPNGPATLFAAKGFHVVEILDRVVLREGEDTLILMECVF